MMLARSLDCESRLALQVHADSAIIVLPSAARVQPVPTGLGLGCGVRNHWHTRLAKGKCCAGNGFLRLSSDRARRAKGTTKVVP